MGRGGGMGRKGWRLKRTGEQGQGFEARSFPCQGGRTGCLFLPDPSGIALWEASGPAKQCGIPAELA